jgi:hypothetical protein
MSKKAYKFLMKIMKMIEQYFAIIYSCMLSKNIYSIDFKRL